MRTWKISAIHWLTSSEAESRNAEASALGVYLGPRPGIKQGNGYGDCICPYPCLHSGRWA